MGTPPLHVLVVDDELVVAVTVAGMLEQYGFRVTVAHDGLEALEAERADPPDILVTDLRMPNLDGNGLVTRIRASCPDLPVVVMTGYSNAIPSEEVGRLTILRKPFRMEQLLSAVQNVLGMAKPRPA